MLLEMNESRDQRLGGIGIRLSEGLDFGLDSRLTQWK